MRDKKPRFDKSGLFHDPVVIKCHDFSMKIWRLTERQIYNTENSSHLESGVAVLRPSNSEHHHAI